jgi:ABC-type proline/glycine betaine transport system permease subunit
MLRLIWNIFIVMIGAVGAGAALMVLAGKFAPVSDLLAGLAILVFCIAMIVDAITDMVRSARDAG